MYNIINDFKNVSYTKSKFLSDKSYAYDTVFFVSKFITKFQKEDIFNLRQNVELLNKYIIDIFNRNPDSDGTSNYYSEVLNLFEYADVIEKIDYQIYKIINKNVLLFINERMENAYIFNYLLTYNTFKNDNLLMLYKEICNADDLDEKTELIQELNSRISVINVSVRTPGTVWEKLNTKYALTVLNFINKQNYVTRELKAQSRIADIESISVNVNGTKTYDNLPKNNNYLKKFDVEYVRDFLKSFLFVKFEEKTPNITKDETSEITEMADLKLDILELQNDTKDAKIEFVGEQYVENVIKSRNAGAQRRFRNNLFKYTSPKCAICGLPISELLTASHIKPYSKCEEVYDAVNYENGFLLCPIHDALFESARYITIDSSDGTIKIKNKYKQFKNSFNLPNSDRINSGLLTPERKHYLKWHNERFNETNK